MPEQVSKPVAERVIYANDTIKNSARQPPYVGNKIATAKYNVFTFFPIFLVEQFSKAANLFFLFITTLQHIGDLSPFDKFGTDVPLAIVLIATAIKELIEDVKRHQQDAEVNARLVNTLNGAHFQKKQWKDVVVGEIVRIENGESFPADLVLLSSSEPDALCYIETSNLDGETNLKIRQGLQETSDILTPEQVSSIEAVIRSEEPNKSLYTYEGTLSYQGIEIPLNPDQILLRGAILRNTRWVYGVVIFTGYDSKLMKNSTVAPFKSTKVERMVNKQILYLFTILVCISVLCALGTLGRQLNSPFETNILRMNTSGAWAMFAPNILTYIILFNNLIPLSLMVTMEFAKFFLGQMINYDVQLYHEESGTPAVARTSNLVEELGQIDYIFSDKTGTLTRNIMEFKMCTIGGIPYAETVPDDKKITVDEIGKVSGYYDFSRLKSNEASHPTAPIIKEFLQLLAVCHTVIPEESEDHPGKITYQASSPDEGALVKGAEMLGYQFRTRRPKSVIYVSEGKEYEYAILNICEFNSTRKRMSAIVRDPDGQIKLYIKGADTVILERLGKGQEFVEATSQYLEEYANEGLRTLCLAYRNVSAEEYTQWSQIYNKAAATINNRGAELDKAAELIERDLFLLGATAIEDKLQDGVPDTIYTLAQAGIKIWVLTGDRQETAINIGYSCKLITEDMGLIIVNEKTHFETKDFIEKKLAAIKANIQKDNLPEIADDAAPGFSYNPRTWLGPLYQTKIKKEEIVTSTEPIVLIIDGRSLDFALEDDIKMIFLELAIICKAVICCRVSPLQKALVVKLVKNNIAGSVTLAIGDGANDVPMIQAAHVGIGISGMEGLQAARSADFAIGQFRFLRKLLLVHGSWAYSRMSKLVLFMFYKNITLYIIQLWYASQNGFSGQTIFETWTQAAYNILLTALQPLALAVFDQYISAKMLDRYPDMYKLGQNAVFYNDKTFGYWICNCFYHSIILYFGFSYVYGEGIMFASGREGGNWALGEMIYTGDLITITLKAALVADTWVKFTFIAFFGSILFWIFFFPTYAVVGPLVEFSIQLKGLAPILFGSFSFWLAIIVIPVFATLRDYVWKAYKRNAYPKTYHIIQEIQKFNIPDHRPRMEVLKKAVQKARMTQRIKKARGFAFSQNESGQADLIRVYDTTRRKPKG